MILCVCARIIDVCSVSHSSHVHTHVTFKSIHYWTELILHRVSVFVCTKRQTNNNNNINIESYLILQINTE